MGSNDKSLMALTLFARYDLERNGVRKSKLFKLYLRIIVPALSILIPLIMDISSDVALTVNYASDLYTHDPLKNIESLNSTIIECVIFKN